MTQKNIEMKRAYEKPSMKVYQLAINQHLLQASETTLPLPIIEDTEDPNPSEFQW